MTQSHADATLEPNGGSIQLLHSDTMSPRSKGVHHLRASLYSFQMAGAAGSYGGRQMIQIAGGTCYLLASEIMKIIGHKSLLNEFI